MTDQLIMTTAQRDTLIEALNTHPDFDTEDLIISEAVGMLQSLPVVQGEPVTNESLLGAIGRAWCYPCNAHKTMDADLALAMCTEVSKLYTSPQALTQISEPLEELLGQYWDNGYKEGESGEPNGDKANEILHNIRMLFKPITPITADDVTDEMLEAVKKAIPMQGVVTREKVVAIYNAVIKNWSEAR